MTQPFTLSDEERAYYKEQYKKLGPRALYRNLKQSGFCAQEADYIICVCEDKEENYDND